MTQRSISDQLGVALGLANRVIRRLVEKGYLKVAPRGNGYGNGYEVTPLGCEALMQARRLAFERTVDGYTRMREQICGSLAVLASCRDAADGQTGIVFYGAGNVAEIAYVAVQRSHLTLVGVVDDYRCGRFFDFTIHRPDALTPEALDGIPYSRLLVTSIRHAEAIQSRLKEQGVPASRICSL